MSKIEKLLEKALELSKAKFDASVDVCIWLPKGETLQTSMELPVGKKMDLKVWVFTDEDSDAALSNGATRAGLDDLISDIKANKFDADICLASKKIFSKLVTIAKQLGPRGLMPSEKSGTVADKIIPVLKNVISGKQLKLKSDSAGYIRVSIGKKSSSKEDLCKNIIAVTDYVKKSKPGKELRSIFLNVCMGSSVKLPLNMNEE